MGREPFFKVIKRVKPAPPAPPPIPTPPDKKQDSISELVGFTPPVSITDPQPASDADAIEQCRRNVRRLTWALGALAFFTVFFCLGPELYRGLKAWRASGLAREGEELVRHDRIEEAIPTIRSAFLLSPNAPEVLRAMAQILTTLNFPTAMTYWNWVLETSSATDDDRRAAADCAMQNGLYNEASKLIQDLISREGKDARNQLLSARWCEARATPAQTMYYATRAVNDDPTYKPAVLFLATQELTNPYLHQEGVNSLFKLADGDDDAGLQALRQLDKDPNLKPAEIDRLVARLHTHPLAAEFERLGALALEIKRHPDQRAALIDQAVAAHRAVTPADVATFGEWLNTHHEAERTLKLIPREKALSDKDLFAAYIDALGSLGRWENLKTVLTGTTVPLEASTVELYLSRCSSQLGDEQGSELHWQNAVSASAYNPAEALRLAVYAEKLGQNDRAAAVYRSLTQDPVASRVAYNGLIRVLRDKDARTLRDILEQMVSRWPQDNDMAAQYVYFNLLINERVEEMRQSAFTLMNLDSYSIAPRTDVALACLRLKDPHDAMKAYENVTINWNTASVPDLVVYAATLQANGQTAAARQMLSTVNRHELRPEQRDLIKAIP
jgi:hypothetical protein